MANDTITEWVEGVVANANDKGFKLAGSESWLNVSKYATPAPMIPAKGLAVRVGLDKGGFVRSVERGTVQQQAAAAPRADEPGIGIDTATSRPGYTSAFDPGERDIRITRLAVLNTATAILSSGGRAIEQPAAVVSLAATLEAWVLSGTAPEQPAQRPALRVVGHDGPTDAQLAAASADTGNRDEFFALAEQLHLDTPSICMALKVRNDGGMVAIRDWRKSGHTWAEGMTLLRAFVAEEGA